MKLLFLLVIAFLISATAYIASSFILKRAYGRANNRWWPAALACSVFFILLGLIGVGMYASSRKPDLQCSSQHTTTLQPSSTLTSAVDYYNQGNYDFETGHCQQAVADYTKSIALDPSFPQAYNNRAYANMRLRNFKDALPDLDKAIALKPDYVEALMNRGDIHNYYYQVDRQAAIADYRKVIAITGPTNSGTSVCGHLFLAEHNGWNLAAYLDYFRGKFMSCQ